MAGPQPALGRTTMAALPARADYHLSLAVCRLRPATGEARDARENAPKVMVSRQGFGSAILGRRRANEVSFVPRHRGVQSRGTGGCSREAQGGAVAEAQGVWSRGTGGVVPNFRTRRFL
jgi:hypothetical protein